MITVKELTKRYGAHTAVDALSFTVDKGQIYGLLGPNGAGKSTTMNIITGYISAMTALPRSTAAIFSTALQRPAPRSVICPSSRRCIRI